MAQASVWMHETVLAPVPASASEARDFVCLHLIEHQMLYLVEDIRLVASEFATIAMLRSQSSFTMELQRIDDDVRLTVTEAPPSLSVRALAPASGTGGQGLSVVEVVSQAWGVEARPEGARALWASFGVRSRSRPHDSRG